MKKVKLSDKITQLVNKANNFYGVPDNDSDPHYGDIILKECQ